MSRRDLAATLLGALLTGTAGALAPIALNDDNPYRYWFLWGGIGMMAASAIGLAIVFLMKPAPDQAIPVTNSSDDHTGDRVGDINIGGDVNNSHVGHLIVQGPELTPEMQARLARIAARGGYIEVGVVAGAAGADHLASRIRRFLREHGVGHIVTGLAHGADFDGIEINEMDDGAMILVGNVA